MSSVIITYTFSVERCTIESDQVWEHLLKLKEENGREPLDVSVLVSRNNNKLDKQLTDTLIQAIEGTDDVSMKLSEYLDMTVRPKGKAVTLAEYRDLKTKGLWEQFKSQK